ncbi:MAG: hypothetical protein M1820_000495 [Bogoriella megaspora]|nr:MAG: hypothetical protein M1820_000495 [Bogoriella megaspora]
MDYIHRRDQSSEGIPEYPDEVLAVHETCTTHLWASSTSKVMVVYGKKVRSRMLAKAADEYSLLPLWGQFTGINLVLAHESNYKNADPKYRFRRAILFASHPQHLFYQKLGSDVLRAQDKILLAATQMAASRSIISDPMYFEQKKFLKHLPNNLKNAIGQSNIWLPKDFHYHLDLHASVESNKSWSSALEQKPHSNDTLAKLLPAALEACDEYADADWAHPSDLPKAVFEWLRGQGEILFMNLVLSQDVQFYTAMQNVHISLKKDYIRVGITGWETPMSIRDMLCCILRLQMLSLDRAQSSAVYLMVKMMLQGSPFAAQGAMPRDIDILWIPNVMKVLEIEARPMLRRWQDCVLDRAQPLPLEVVECWCMNCEEDTELDGLPLACTSCPVNRQRERLTIYGPSDVDLHKKDFPSFARVSPLMNTLNRGELPHLLATTEYWIAARSNS